MGLSSLYKDIAEGRLEPFSLLLDHILREGFFYAGMDSRFTGHQSKF